MRAFTLSLTLALTLASLLTSAALLPRSQVCADDGTTRAGDLFSRADPPPPLLSLHPRGKYPIPCAICVRNTRTFLLIRTFEPISGAMGILIQGALNEFLERVNAVIGNIGDMTVPTGCMNVASNGVRWISTNANNHQQTMAVVSAALKGLIQFMNTGQVGWVSFEIWDGFNQVGGGQVFREWEGPLDSGGRSLTC